MGKGLAGAAYRRRGRTYSRGKGKPLRMRLYWGSFCLFIGTLLIIVGFLTGK